MTQPLVAKRGSKYLARFLVSQIPADLRVYEPTKPTEPDLSLRNSDGPDPQPTYETYETPSWSDVADLRWGPEWDDPAWDRAKGLLAACAFSGLILTLDGNRLVVTETRDPMTDDDRDELAGHEAELIPLVRARKETARVA